MILTQEKSKTGFYIGVTCPNCGAKLEIESDFFVLTCDFCRSILKIDMPDTPPAYLLKAELPKREIRFFIDRYLKKNNLPLTGSDITSRALYYPYWKINATVLRVRNKTHTKYVSSDSESGQEVTTEQHLTDIRLSPFITTIAAGPPNDNIPHSLGLRTEYMKLWPFSAESTDDQFDTAPVVKSWADASATLDKTMFSLDKIAQADFGKNITECFNPVGAIVYFPYYAVSEIGRNGKREYLLDGVSGRVLKLSEKRLVEDDLSSGESSHIKFGKLEVGLHRCYNCGQDLPDKRSAVYVCKNCGCLTQLEKSGFGLNQILTAEDKITPNDKFFPFWSLKLSESETKKLRLMFGGIFNSDQLVVPAFRLSNFESTYRLCKRISSARPKIDFHPVEILNDIYQNIDLPLSEAILTAEILIYREQVERGVRTGKEKNKTQIIPKEISLIYVPFHRESYFYVDSIFNAVTFEKNSIIR